MVPNDTPGINFGKRDFSIELWVKTKVSQYLSAILDKRDKEHKGYHLFIWKGNPGAQVSDTASPNNAVLQGKTIMDDKWHHVAAVAQRLPRKEIMLYLDGKLHAESRDLVTVADLNVNEPLLLGKHHPNMLIDGPRYFAGDMDELTFYRRVLKPEEIAAIYRAGRSGKCRTGK